MRRTSAYVSAVRPSMPETTALGAAIAAGVAEGIDIWNLDSTLNNVDATADIFTPSIPESSELSTNVSNIITDLYIANSVVDFLPECHLPLDYKLPVRRIESDAHICPEHCSGQLSLLPSLRLEMT